MSDLTGLIDIKIYHAKATYDSGTAAWTTVVTNIPIAGCIEGTKYYIGGIEIEDPSGFLSKNAFCINMPVDKTLPISGSFANEENSYEHIKIRIGKCDYNQPGHSCSNRTVTRSKLANVEVILSYPMPIVDPENLENPVKYVSNGIVIRLSTDTVKHRRISWKKSIINTDLGWFTPQVEERTVYDVDTINYDETDSEHLERYQEFTPGTDTKTLLPVPYGYIYHLSGKSVTVIDRSYTRLQDALGNVGGVMEVILVALTLLYTWYVS